MLIFYQLRELPQKQGQQKGSDVGSVYVRVAHDDDLVVTQLLKGKLFAHPGAQGGDDGPDLLIAENLIKAGLFNVKNLPLDRQDRLEPPVSALLGRAAGRVAFHNVDLAH